MKIVLVTGGYGFIGTHLLEYLLQNTEYNIINVDKLTYAANPNYIQKFITNNNYSNRLTNFNFDISNKEYCKHLFETNKIDKIIHLAAESHVDNSITGPAPFIQSNIVGTFNVLDLAKQFNIQKVVYVSTDEVYGALTNLDQEGFREDRKLEPSSVYSASKASADLLALSYFKTYGLDINITRCCNNFGAYQHQEKLIPKIIINALQGKYIPVYGTGENMREWIHAKDHCLAICKVLENGKAGEIYNIGSGVLDTNINIVTYILDYLGRSHNLIEYVEDRKGHDFIYKIDSTKIRRELKWKPYISSNFSDQLKGTIDWYVEEFKNNIRKK